MKLKRYEILLPLAYNDGSPVEPEKHAKTFKELRNQFGAATLGSTVAIGHWMHKGKLYEDKLIRYRLDIADSPETHNFFEEYKQVLEERFSQLDIYITVIDIEII
jgi:hypothetical protein